VLLLNGTEVVDKARVREASVSSPLTSTLRGLGGLLMLSDGSLGNTSPRDLVTGVPFTMAGGVGGAWTEESNWRTPLGARAPVIAGAVDNLYDNDTASSEAASVGLWTDDGMTPAVSTADFWHGAKCVSGTVAGGNKRFTADIKALTAAGSEYTISHWYKAGNAGAVGKTITLSLVGDTSGATAGAAITLTTSWQRATCTKTFAAGDTTSRGVLVTTNGDATDVVYQDGCQLEAGATASPFALNSRTACSMSIANPLTAGSPFSMVIATSTAWAGNDGVAHYFFQHAASAAAATNRLQIYTKHTDNNAYFFIRDGAGTAKLCSTAALTTTTWAADVKHIIICTRSAAGVMDAYLDGVQFAVINSGAGAGLESAVQATSYFGTLVDGTSPATAPLLVAIYNRVLSSAEISYLSKMTQWLPSLRTVY
jgi:hypothetical protein